MIRTRNDYHSSSSRNYQYTFLETIYIYVKWSLFYGK